MSLKSNQPPSFNLCSYRFQLPICPAYTHVHLLIFTPCYLGSRGTCIFVPFRRRTRFREAPWKEIWMFGLDDRASEYTALVARFLHERELFWSPLGDITQMVGSIIHARRSPRDFASSLDEKIHLRDLSRRGYMGVRSARSRPTIASGRRTLYYYTNLPPRALSEKMSGHREHKFAHVYLLNCCRSSAFICSLVVIIKVKILHLWLCSAFDVVHLHIFSIGPCNID